METEEEGGGGEYRYLSKSEICGCFDWVGVIGESMERVGLLVHKRLSLK